MAFESEKQAKEIAEERSLRAKEKDSNFSGMSLEDLFGTVEVIVFPRDYTRYRSCLEQDKKLFIRGRASVSEEDGKLVCEHVVPFDEVPKELWLQFASIEEFQKTFPSIDHPLRESQGDSSVIIYCRKENARKRMGEEYKVLINDHLQQTISETIGRENVKVVYKKIKKRSRC